jgi:hypothetical protein
LAGALGEHAGGFQAALLQAGEVAPPAARLDRHHRPPCAVPVPSYPGCQSQLRQSTYSAKLFKCSHSVQLSALPMRLEPQRHQTDHRCLLHHAWPLHRHRPAHTHPQNATSAPIQHLLPSLTCASRPPPMLTWRGVHGRSAVPPRPTTTCSSFCTPDGSRKRRARRTDGVNAVADRARGMAQATCFALASATPSQGRRGNTAHAATGLRPPLRRVYGHHEARRQCSAGPVVQRTALFVALPEVRPTRKHVFCGSVARPPQPVALRVAVMGLFAACASPGLRRSVSLSGW